MRWAQMIDNLESATADRAGEKSGRRIVAYWLTPVALMVVFGFAEAASLPGNDELHTDMEIIATVLAAVVGAMALARFHSRKDNAFLFIGVGFLGAAVLDGFHGFATSTYSQSYVSSDLTMLIPWSWMASRLFLSAALLVSVLAWRRERRLGKAGIYGERGVYLGAAALLVAIIGFFVFVPLPVIRYPDLFFSRPQDLAPALLLLLAAIGYLKKGHWREDQFEHWLILSLIVGAVGQAAFMARSSSLFDNEFDVAHLLKIASYVLAMIGLLANTIAIYREAEHSERRFRAAIASMQEGFALFDAADRLVVCNDEYLRLHPGLEDVIKPGVAYERILRAQVERGKVANIAGGAEDHIRHRLMLHRNPTGPIVRELTDGTWYIINEGRVPDGGIAVTETDISELMEAEGALRASEERMRAFMDNTTQSIYLKDTAGRYLLVNKNFERRVGIGAEDIVGKTAHDLFPKDLGDAFEAQDRAVLRSRKAVSQENKVTYRDGSTRFNLTIKFPIFGRDGVPQAVGAVITDITERKQIEEALRDREHQLRTIMESSPVGIAVVLPDENKRLYVNPAMVHMYGAESVAHMLATKISDSFANPDDFRRLKEGDGEDFVREAVVQRKRTDGSTWWCLLSRRPLVYQGKKAMMVWNWDITDRKRAEQVLAEREALTRKILEASPVGVLIVTREGTHLFANERALEIQGVTREELFSHNAGSYYADPDLRTRMKDDLYATGSTPPTEVELVKPDGAHFFVVLSSTLIEFEGRPAHITYLYDIDKIKRAEEAVRRSETLFRTVIDAAPALITVKDTQGRYLMANRYHHDFFGVQPNAWIGLTSDVVSGEHGRKIRDMERAILETGEPMKTSDFELIGVDGRAHYFLTIKSPLREGTGEITGIVTVALDVTERKQAEQALVKKEALTRKMLEASPVGVAVVTREGKHLFANERLLEIQGVTREELFARNSGEFYVDPGLRKRMKDDLYATGSTPPTEVELMKSDGTRYIVVLSSILIEFEGQQAHITYLYDIDKIKRAEDAMRRSENLLRTIIDAVPVMVSVKDAEGRYLMTNRHHHEFFGVQPNAWIGLTSDVISGPHGRKNREMELTVLETGMPMPPTDLMMVDVHGHERHFLVIKNPLRGLTGEIIGTVTASVDVTERKQVEEALRRSETLLRTIMDSVPALINVKDTRGRYLMTNRHHSDFFGVEPNAWIGMTSDIISKEHGLSTRTVDRAILKMGVPVPPYDYKIFDAKGRERYILNVKNPLRGPGGEIVGVVTASVDITERKEVERLKGEFVSTVSHELRTPLTSIRGALGLLMGGAVGAIPDKARSMIDMAEKNTVRLINLVNDILDVEKLESGRMDFRFKRLDLAKLVEQGVAANEGYAREFGVEFAFVESGKDVFVVGDHDRLTQVLTNLLSNAAKFSPRGERVKVTVSRRKGAGRVSVADRGPGIPKEFQDRVFDRFTQADASDTRKVGGTGLGLNISKTIIEKHGGSIMFDTKPGRGSTFHFEVPLWTKKSMPAKGDAS